MRRGPRKPGKHFSTYTHEDRSQWEIRVDTSRNGPGHYFFCRDEGINIEADNPDKVIATLKVKLAEIRAVEWKPVIEVAYDSWRSGGSFNPEFRRAFMGEPPFDPYGESRPLFREWSYDKDIAIDTEDRTEVGKPGRVMNTDINYPIPYDSELWAMLHGIEQASDAIRGSVSALTDGGHKELKDRIEATFKRYAALPPDVRKNPGRHPFDYLKGIFPVEKKA
jgi:hypothetical protein